MADLGPIIPIAPNWTPLLLLVVQAYTTTYFMFNREQQLGPAPPKTGTVRNSWVNAEMVMIIAITYEYLIQFILY